MYVEQQHGEMGFAEKQIRGVGNVPGLGAVTAMSLAAAATPEPPSGRSNLSPQELALIQQQNALMIQQAQSQQARTEKMIVLIAGGAFALGLAYVIFKATKD